MPARFKFHIIFFPYLYVDEFDKLNFMLANETIAYTIHKHYTQFIIYQTVWATTSHIQLTYARLIYALLWFVHSSAEIFPSPTTLWLTTSSIFIVFFQQTKYFHSLS